MRKRVQWLDPTLRRQLGRRWFLFLVHVIVITAVGALLLPAVRRNPESVHAYFGGVQWLQRAAALFAAISLGVCVLFKLLSPRLAHLRPPVRWRHPPIWLAWVVAAAALCLIDLTAGLGPDGYSPSTWDWVGYGFGPLAAVAIFRHITQAPERPTPLPVPAAERSLDGLVGDWTILEPWLMSERPAGEDLIGNRRVACRLAEYLTTQGGTIGLVGPFGSGKSSVVAWMQEEVERNRQPGAAEVWFAEQSCWGFEDSGSAVQQILARAVEAVGRKADCFSLRSLPESYRKTFSAGGDWVRSLADLVLGSSDPVEQFGQLAEVLRSANARLVVVVEDLDRPSAGRFHRQEVQALLQRLKATERVSFVLASGRTPAGNADFIDFTKLCDHIEILRDFDPAWVAALIDAVRSRCLNASEFRHVATVSHDHSPWEPSLIGFMSSYDIVTPAEAAARLLRTPRALKHALRRTSVAWRRLYGEVDLDQLIAVNILRHGAPEAFDFLVRHWDQLHAAPTSSSVQRDSLPRISERLTAEWLRATANVDWEPRAALTLLVRLLPAASQYLGHPTGPDRFDPEQGIGHRRYWLRVVNEEIDPSDVRDQTVFRDISNWRVSYVVPSALIDGLASGGDYVAVWEHYAAKTFGLESSLVLVLADQVLAGYRTPRGARALGWNGQSDPARPVFPERAFSALWLYANGHVMRDDASRDWLENQVRLAMPTSLSLVNDLYYYWASARNGIVRLEDRAHVRGVIYYLAQEQLRTADALLRVLPTTGIHYCLYQLVFTPDSDERPSDYSGLPHWAWLGPVVLEAVRADAPISPVEVGHLIAHRQQGHPAIVNWEVDPHLLTGFFGNAADEVIAWLASARERFTGQDQQLIDQLVSSHNSPQAEVEV